MRGLPWTGELGSSLQSLVVLLMCKLTEEVTPLTISPHSTASLQESVNDASHAYTWLQQDPAATTPRKTEGWPSQSRA